MYVKDHGQCYLVKTICYEGKSLYHKLKVKGFRNVGQRLRSMSQGNFVGMINFLSLMIACGVIPNVLVELNILEFLVSLDVMIFNSWSE